MPADNATNVSRQVDAEARVLVAVETLRSRGEPLGLRTIARLAGASVTTVRKLRRQWLPEDGETVDEQEVKEDSAQWNARLAVFQPHTVEAYEQSIWPEPVRPQTIARWHAEMDLLRRLYGTRRIQLAHATYRMYADWMNAVVDDATQRFSQRTIADLIQHWNGDPAEALLADGALAGIKLPKTITDELLKICHQRMPLE